MSVTGTRAQAGEPRPMRADAQRNYARLLEAASGAFAEHGADDVSLEEIARRAGVGIGTLYRHFPTRQALLEAVYIDQVESLSARARELLRAESPADALAEWLRAMVKFSSTKRNMTTALLATLGTDSELLSSCVKEIKGAAESLLARAQQAGVVRRQGPDQAGARGQHRHGKDAGPRAGGPDAGPDPRRPAPSAGRQRLTNGARLLPPSEQASAAG